MGMKKGRRNQNSRSEMKSRRQSEKKRPYQPESPKGMLRSE